MKGLCIGVGLGHMRHRWHAIDGLLRIRPETRGQCLAPEVEFVPIAIARRGRSHVVCERLKFGPAARERRAAVGDSCSAAAAADRFKGRRLDPRPRCPDWTRRVAPGRRRRRQGEDLKARHGSNLVASPWEKFPRTASDATIVADPGGGAFKPDRAADGVGVRRCR